MDKLNQKASGEQSPDDVSINSVQQKTIDPLDHFLQECGLVKATPSTTTTTTTFRQRSAKEEIAFYVDRVGVKSSPPPRSVSWVTLMGLCKPPHDVHTKQSSYLSRAWDTGARPWSPFWGRSNASVWWSAEL